MCVHQINPFSDHNTSEEPKRAEDSGQRALKVEGEPWRVVHLRLKTSMFVETT